MKQELQDALYAEFPLLFSRKSEYFYGIECGDGWYNLLKELFSKIETIIRNLSEDNKKLFSVDCIKSKFASLRFYVSYNEKFPLVLEQRIEALIREAEHNSGVICERCGANGTKKTIKTNWIITICENCLEKQKKKGIHYVD